MFRTIFTTLRALLKSGLCGPQLCIRSDTASYFPQIGGMFLLKSGLRFSFWALEVPEPWGRTRPFHSKLTVLRIYKRRNFIQKKVVNRPTYTNNARALLSWAILQWNYYPKQQSQSPPSLSQYACGGLDLSPLIILKLSVRENLKYSSYK